MAVPEPAELALVDMEARQINASVVVVGAAAHAFVSTVQAAATQEDAAAPDAPSYLRVTLGEIRTFTCHFHLYAFTNDFQYLQDADAVILAGAKADDVETSVDVFQAGADPVATIKEVCATILSKL